MLFWIWFYAYSYSDKRNNQLKEFLLTTSFVGSEQNYNLLDKSFMVLHQIHHIPFDIHTTLLLFEMGKHLPDDIKNDPIHSYLSQKL